MSQTVLRVSDLSQSEPTLFDYKPDAKTAQALVKELDVLALRKLRLSGKITPHGKSDWNFDGLLGATIVQPCVVTSAPVTTRIDVPVQRLFLAQYQDPDLPEVEMHDDERIEPLGSEIDLAVILSEALALNLPLYPRQEDADLGQAVFTEPGKTPMRDEDAKPFAGLANLRDHLKKEP